MDKNADLIFNVSATSNQYTASKIRFSTQDEGSAKLTFFLFKDGVQLPLSAVTGKIGMRMTDGSKFIDTVAIVDRIKGIVEYKLTQEQLKHFGQVIAELYLNYTDGQKMSVHRFSFRIEKALIDSDIAVLTEYYIDDFEGLRTSILAMADEYREIINTVGEDVDQAKELAEEVISLINENNAVGYPEYEQNNIVIQSQLTSIEESKADQAFVDAQLAAIVSGAPTATFSTLNALKTQYPNGTIGVFLVLSDGHWYYWNADALSWLDGGLYQAKDLEDNTVTLAKLKNPVVQLINQNSVTVDYSKMEISVAAGRGYILTDSSMLRFDDTNPNPVSFAALNVLGTNNYNSYQIYIDMDDNRKLKVAQLGSVTSRNYTIGYIYRDRVIGNEIGIRCLNTSGYETTSQKNGSVSQVALRNALWYVLLRNAIEINIKDKKVYIKENIHALNGLGWSYLDKTVQTELDFSSVYTSSDTLKLYMDFSDSNKLKMVRIGTDTGNNPILAYVFLNTLVTANPSAIYLVNSQGITVLPINDSSISYTQIRNPFAQILHLNSIEINYKAKKINLLKDLYVYNESNHSRYVQASTFTPIDISAFPLGSTDYNSYFLYVDLSDGWKLKFDVMQNVKGNTLILARVYQDRVMGNEQGIKVINTKGFQASGNSFVNAAWLYSSNLINIDTTAKTVTSEASQIVIFDNGNRQLPVQTYTYSDSNPAGYIRKLYINRDDGTFLVKMYDEEVRGNYGFICMFSGSGTGATVIAPFDNQKRIKVDGVAYNERAEAGGDAFPWATNKFVIPKELYLLKDVPYTIHAQNFNFNKYLDNERLLFEMVLPMYSKQFENTLDIRHPYSGDFLTQIVGMYNGATNSALGKDVTLRFADPAAKTKKDPAVLCIGDSITNANIPYLIKYWLQNFGFTPTMIGTRDNANNSYGYGIEGVMPSEKGEGRGGWRLTDFTGTTKRADGSSYLYPGNNFWNPDTQAFDFGYYMRTNGFAKVDYVVIMLLTNDISGFHNQKAEANIGTPTIEEIMAYAPTEYKKIIDSIHAYDPNIKIGINPPVPGGVDSSFNLKAAKVTEVLQNNFDGKIANVYSLASYLSSGAKSGKTWGTYTRTPVSDINDTKKSNMAFDVHDNGMNQLVNALWSASWIINRSN